MGHSGNFYTTEMGTFCKSGLCCLWGWKQIITIFISTPPIWALMKMNIHILFSCQTLAQISVSTLAHLGVDNVRGGSLSCVLIFSRILACTNYSSTSLSSGDMFQDLQWMPKTKDSTKPCICCFLCTHIPVIKFNL